MSKVTIWFLALLIAGFIAYQANSTSQQTGDLVKVKLTETVGTGYAWRIVYYDCSILEYKGLTYLTDSSRLGGTRYAVFTFKVKKTGEVTKATFEYKRSWEAEIVETKVVEIKTR